jgi:PadR family transcriptional regulator PadR
MLSLRVPATRSIPDFPRNGYQIAARSLEGNVRFAKSGHRMVPPQPATRCRPTAGNDAPCYRQEPMGESLQIQLKKGVLEMCVLALLSKGDNYAYDIASRMAEAVGMGEGTIYPLMRRMQNDGLVSTYLQESGSGPPRKYYTLTKRGAHTLKAQISEWVVFETAVRKVLGAL